MIQAIQTSQILPSPSEQASLSVGDRVITPTGRTGRIIPPNADLPLHCLILFDDDRTFWMLKEILKPAPIEPVKKQRRSRK